MEWIKEFFACFGDSFLMLALTVVVSLFGAAFKKLYRNSLNDETKKNIADLCVRATEQMFGDYAGENKNYRAKEEICRLLSERGVAVSDEELSVLVESAVNRMNSSERA